MGLGASWHQMVMPTSNLCHQVLPWSMVQHSAMLWLSVFPLSFPLSLCPMGSVARRSRSQLELGAGRCRIPMMLWEGR